MEELLHNSGLVFMGSSSVEAPATKSRGPRNVPPWSDFVQPYDSVGGGGKGADVWVRRSREFTQRALWSRGLGRVGWFPWWAKIRYRGPRTFSLFIFLFLICFSFLFEFKFKFNHVLILPRIKGIILTYYYYLIHNIYFVYIFFSFSNSKI
jgi:hypothetical protein